MVHAQPIMLVVRNQRMDRRIRPDEPKGLLPPPASALIPESAWSSASQSSAWPHNDHVVADHPLSRPIGTAPDLASMVAEAVADAGHRRRRRHLAGDCIVTIGRRAAKPLRERDVLAPSSPDRGARARPPKRSPGPEAPGRRRRGGRGADRARRAGFGLCLPRSAEQPDPYLGTVLSPAFAGRSGIEKRGLLIGS